MMQVLCHVAWPRGCSWSAAPPPGCVIMARTQLYTPGLALRLSPPGRHPPGREQIMYFDAVIQPPELRDAGPIAGAAERLGLQALWTTEIQHDPFLPLALAAIATERVQLGTAIALAFPRSPTAMAYTAWDLARASQGRFILGLGTQVKAHIERRFAAPWDAPVARLRDYIAAMRAVWTTWQTGERLRYESE